MGKPITGSDTQPINTSDGTDQPINPPDTKSKPGTRRTRKPPKQPPTIKANQTEETQVILEPVTSEAARDNIDIRLKSANIESLPDESVLVGGAAAMLVLLLDGIGMMVYGDFAKLNDLEKQMVQEPLQRILAKVSPNSLNLIGKYADPVLLVMGLMSWISRVTMENKRREAAKTSPPPTNEPKPVVVEPKTPEAAKPEFETNPPAEIISSFQSASNIL